MGGGLIDGLTHLNRHHFLFLYYFVVVFVLFLFLLVSTVSLTLVREWHFVRIVYYYHEHTIVKKAVKLVLFTCGVQDIYVLRGNISWRTNFVEN